MFSYDVKHRLTVKTVSHQNEYGSGLSEHWASWNTGHTLFTDVSSLSVHQVDIRCIFVVGILKSSLHDFFEFWNTTFTITFFLHSAYVILLWSIHTKRTFHAFSVKYKDHNKYWQNITSRFGRHQYGLEM